MDKIANTVGHFDSYLKKNKFKKLKIKLIRVEEHKNIKIYCVDANKLVRKVYGDLFYIDPPYNSRQYSRFYHLYENYVKWEKPNLYGVARKPLHYEKSEYCTKNAKEVFNDLIEHINSKYILVSYNNTYNSKSNSSKNKITFEEIEQILSKQGKLKIFSKRYKYFNTGNTNFTDHREFLFLLKKC